MRDPLEETNYLIGHVRKNRNGFNKYVVRYTFEAYIANEDTTDFVVCTYFHILQPYVFQFK